MSQIDFIRDTVSDFFDELTSSGIADIGQYVDQPGDDPVEVRVFVRRAVKSIGEFSKAPAQAFQIRIVNADAPIQRRGATVAVQSETYGTETFQLVNKLDDTGALTTWSVTRE